MTDLASEVTTWLRDRSAPGLRLATIHGDIQSGRSTTLASVARLAKRRGSIVHSVDALSLTESTDLDSVEACARSIERTCARAPVILICDDIDWLGRAAAAFATLCWRLRLAPATVVQSTTSLAAIPAPMQRLADRLSTGAQARNFPLRPLTAEQAWPLSQTLPGPRPHRWLVDEFCRLASGNIGAFLATVDAWRARDAAHEPELSDDLVLDETHPLVRAASSATEQRPGPTSVVRGLGALLPAHVDDLDVLTTVADADQSQIRRLVDQLVVSRHVTFEPADGVLRFRVPIVGVTLASNLNPQLREAIRREVSSRWIIRAQSGDGPDRARAARAAAEHLVTTTRSTLDPAQQHALIDAADSCAAPASVFAARCYNTALKSTPNGSPQQIRAGVGLVTVLCAAAQWSKAARYASDFMLATDGGLSPEAKKVLASLLTTAHRHLAAAPAVTTDTPSNIVLEADLARARIDTLVERFAAASEALRFGDTSDPLVAARRRVLHSIQGLRSPAPNRGTYSASSVRAMWTCLRLGDLVGAEAALEPHGTWLHEPQSPSSVAASRVRSAFVDGRWDEVLHTARQLTAECDAAESSLEIRTVRAVSGYVLAASGDSDTALQLLNAADAPGPLGSFADVARALALSASGKHAQARDLTLARLEHCRDVGDVVGQAEVLHMLIATTYRAGRCNANCWLSELRAVVNRLPGNTSAHWRLAWCSARVHHDRRVALDALELAEQLSQPELIAHSQLLAGDLGLAENHHLPAAYRSFDALGATHWQKQTRELLRARRLPVPRRRRRPDHLRDDEVQILELVSKGATNLDLAAAMSMTVKGVEARLARMFRRTSCASRTELSEWYQTVRSMADSLGSTSVNQ